MSIGDRLKQCRIAMGYSAEQVAAKLGISPATMYRYENGFIGKMPAHLLGPLSEYLCTTPGYLMGWTQEGAPVMPTPISETEKRLLTSYRAADPKYQSLALELLEEHPAKSTAQSAG